MQTWPGFAEESTTQSDIHIEDFFDCDGSRGINALLIDTSALWCGACQQDAMDMSALLESTWKDLGVHVLTLIDEDNDSNPGTPQNALAWKTTYKLDRATVAADPADSFIDYSKGAVGLPVGTIVDPRTMKVLSVEQGYSGDFSALEALAKKNKM
jgi:hypothetical protein